MTASDADALPAGAMSGRERGALAGLFREPLFGFCIVGVLVFGLDASFSEPERPRILIETGTVDRFVEERELVLGRTLSAAEREDIVTRLVDSEILAREAVARDLHLNDLKLRESLAARMNFLLEDAAIEPTDEDLASLRTARPDRYMLPKTVTFRHAFFPKSEIAADAALVEIRAGRLDPAKAGERFWLGHRMERYAASQLLTVLGGSFVSVLRNLPQAEWAGPVQSGRGWHLVYLEGFHEPEALPPEELDRRLREDWQEQQQRVNRDAAIAELRAGYTIDVIDPDAAADGKNR